MNDKYYLLSHYVYVFKEEAHCTSQCIVKCCTHQVAPQVGFSAWGTTQMLKSYLNLLQTSSKTNSLKKLFCLLSLICNQRFPVKSLKRRLLPLLHQHFQNPEYTDFVNFLSFPAVHKVRFLLCHCEVFSQSMQTGDFEFLHHTCVCWIVDRDWLPNYLWCHKSWSTPWNRTFENRVMNIKTALWCQLGVINSSFYTVKHSSVGSRGKVKYHRYPLNVWTELMAIHPMVVWFTRYGLLV